MPAQSQDDVILLSGIARSDDELALAKREAFGPTRSLHNAVSRTWELEMLISGAVLFALFQLPGVVDGLFQQLAPHATQRTMYLLTLVYLYGKAIVYALIGCFSVHLAARAYWVGLIGLDAVFPGGICWDKLRSGTLTKAMYRERLTSLPVVIARTDRFCSVLFSFGFLLVVGNLFGLLGVVMLATVDHLESRFLFGHRPDRTPVPVTLTVVGGIVLLLVVVDRVIGHRLDPAGRPARALRRGLGGYFWLLAGPAYHTTWLVLATNLPKRLTYTLFYVASFGLIAAIVVEMGVREGRFRVGANTFFPDVSVHNTVATQFYENQRGGRVADRSVPTIQADVIEGPYVRLFIPYSPERHNAAIAAECPAATPLNPGGVRRAPRAPRSEQEAAAGEVLRCLTHIHQVTLNGRLLEDLELHFHVHPETGVSGMLAYIAADGLPQGRNLLTIRPASAPDGNGTAAEPEPHFEIPFWR